MFERLTEWINGLLRRRIQKEQYNVTQLRWQKVQLEKKLEEMKQKQAGQDQARQEQ